MESHNLSCEPMDIDTSGHSVKQMDISYNDSIDVKPLICIKKRDISYEQVQLRSKELQSHPTVKKYHINIQKPIKSHNTVVLQILSAGIIILVSIFTFHIYSLKCCDDFKLDVLKNTLSNKLFGQTEAVNVIIKTLELEERSKLMFFSGGTGVGKTFASSILLETIGSCSNVYHYTMPSFTSTFSTDFMLGLTICKMSLIIIDDLTVNDMHIKTQIKEVIEKSEHLSKGITVILIFNCHELTKEFIKNCDESFHKRLLENFGDIKALKTIVDFKTLSEINLKECIRQEMGRRKLDEKEFEDILKNFNVTVDGCKGVHSKMKYLNIV